MTLAAAVLVLDAEWRPLRVAPWQNTLKKVLNGRLEVVECSRDHTITMCERSMPLPSVVRVLRHFKRDRFRIKFSRANVYARDKFTCQYCGQRRMSEDLNLDHVIPRSRGGRTTWENIVTACIRCNSQKADRTPVEAGLKLISQPRKPLYLPSIKVKMKSGDIPPEWKPYWTAELME